MPYRRRAGRRRRSTFRALDRRRATCSACSARAAPASGRDHAAAGTAGGARGGPRGHFFFFKQKTAYEIGLGIPAEPLFRSSFASLRQNCVTVFSFSKNHFSSPSGRWSIVLLISSWGSRSEERFSRNAETDLVCRLLLEKKKIIDRYPSEH